MKMMNLSLAAATACVLATSAHALKTEDRVLKGNMQVEYTKAPGDVNSITEMFTKGEVYGRLRSNMFWWDWDQSHENVSSINDNNMWGLGGSLVYKTGFWNGLGATVGFYGTVPMTNDNTIGTTNYGKAGKDTYHTRPDGTEGAIGVFAEAYGEYKRGKTDLKIGRQMIDSKMLASNDTKMVPNTFEAAVIENKDLPDTTVRLGYVMSQKLRDHQSFHSVIAYNDDTSKVYGNDDSGVHKGLKNTAIRAAGEDIDPEMILATVSNKSIPNLKLEAEYVGLDGFFNTVVAEANYQIKLSDAWTLTPGVRYLRQMDDGAGAIGGAALKGGVSSSAASGYTNPDSVDGSIIMARLVAENGPLTLQAGYAKISDDADIIAPWRGFPTGGYVRSMAQVDWLANTKNWAVKASYDFGKANIISGFKVAADYENINQDELKGYYDRDIIHVDMWKTFKEVPNTEFKFRVGLVDSDMPYASDKESYNEYRFEVNYLF